MRVKSMLILSLIAVVALGLVTAQADPRQLAQGGKGGGDRIGIRGERAFSPGPHWRGRMHCGFYERLGLTKDQKKKMRGLVGAFLNDTRSARTAKMALKDEKRAMIISGKIDPKRLAAIDDEMVKAKAQIMKERLKMKRAGLALLTEEQRDRLGDIMSRKVWKKRHRARHRRGF